MLKFSRGVSVALVATMVLVMGAEAKTTHARVTHAHKPMSAAQVEQAKTNIDRTGTASTVPSAESAAKPRRACTNMSCLGWGSLLGVAY